MNCFFIGNLTIFTKASDADLRLLTAPDDTDFTADITLAMDYLWGGVETMAFLVQGKM